MTWQLGKLSEKYESDGRGPGTVSSGKNDPGGVSYGTYQMASKTGTVALFVAREGAPWLRDVVSLPGRPRFTAAWQDAARRDPVGFGAAQHAFIERTHYRPCVAAVKAATGLDLDTRANAIRDATWSCSVQHGRAAKILADAVVRTDKSVNRSDTLYDAKLLDVIYAVRSDYVLKIAAGLPVGPADQLTTVVFKRYPDELKRAKEMLA